MLIGDLEPAISTHDAFWTLWQRYRGLPERYVLNANQLHSTERYYPLRPEFVESTYHLYTATQHPYYLSVRQCKRSCVVCCVMSGVCNPNLHRFNA